MFNRLYLNIPYAEKEEAKNLEQDGILKKSNGFLMEIQKIM